mmetsp:Transcript_234/g.287  ORF Transcript_234/g.287 Transcript_234/m.287 type:complete len:755 (-) Transcript_234:342-2606(-)
MQQPVPVQAANAMSPQASTPEGQSTPTTTTTTSSSQAATSETLMARLRAQVEFYFSPQNLARDTYLRNLLSFYGGHAVPLSVIANFPKVRDLCSSAMGIPTNEVPADPALLMRSLEGSNVVYVTPDAQWITPKQPLPPLDPASSKRPLPGNFRSQSVTIPANTAAATSPAATATATPTKPISDNVDEKTIIVEKLSSEVPVENIMAALTFGNVVPKSARSEAGNKWSVVFASVPDARAAIVASKENLIEGNPIDARIKVEVQNPGQRKISPPNSAAAPRQVNPIVALNQQQQQQQLPPQHQMAQMQQVQVNGRPNMVSRSQSSPAHYNLNNGQPVPHNNMSTHPQGIPMPAGAVPGYPYAYGYRNMPAPGNYQQTGYVYPNHIQQVPVPQQGSPQMQYMYPGYTYVAAGSPNYYPQGGGRPVLMRDNSSRSQRSLPYENGHPVRTVGNNTAGSGSGTGTSGGTRRQDGGKKDRKNRNRKNLGHYDQGQGQGQGYQGGMSNRPRGPKESLNAGQTDGEFAKRDNNNNNMPRNKSQNEMYDSSGAGGGKNMKRKKDKSKKKTFNDRRKDEVTLDTNNFPALSEKLSAGTEKTSNAGFSGYADALRQKNNAPLTPTLDSTNDEEAGLTEQVNALKVSASEDFGESESPIISVGALTGTPTPSKESPLGSPSMETKMEASRSVENIETKSPAKIVDNDAENTLQKDALPEVNGEVRDAASLEKTDDKSQSAGQEPTQQPEPPPTWGSKRSFIDVVRKS